MSELFYHETLYRGAGALERLAQPHLTVCGAGAVGSHLVDNLARQGLRRLTVIDSDRVKARNVGTQIYAQSDAGAFKVELLQAEVFRAVGVEIVAVRKRLSAQNVRRLLDGADLVIDGFDNHESRLVVAEHCRTVRISCLHVGLSADYGEVIWNDGYRVPGDSLQPGANACNYPLARNLIQIAVALASEAVLRFLLEGQQRNYSFTLRDLQINVE
jgi:molybdopterin/thiamine biosynthesis adenylyltransferase